MALHRFLVGTLSACGRVFKTHVLYIVAACALTVTFVLSGFDWWYFVHTRSELLWSLLIPVAPLGFFVPILLPLLLWCLGKYRGSTRLTRLAILIAQAEIAGWLISSGMKSLTGRVHPELSVDFLSTDTSHVFNFGFWKEGIFWGWPSSHTTVAFASATVLRALYPASVWAKIFTVYAWYIGIGVSATIHWFSDFVAGALVGTAVGKTVIYKIEKS